MEQIMGRSISVTSYRWARCARLRQGDGGTGGGGKGVWDNLALVADCGGVSVGLRGYLLWNLLDGEQSERGIESDC